MNRMKTVFKKKPEDMSTEFPTSSSSSEVQAVMMPINPIVPKTTATFFFNDQRCQNRALYMTARLKQTLNHPLRPRSSHGALREAAISPTPSLSTPTKPPPPTVDPFWRTIAHRLYTLNYILFVLPSNSHARADFLNRIEAELSLKSDGQELQRRGGMEAHFAVRYALQHKRPKRRKTLLEDAFEAEKRNGGNVAGAVLPSSRSDDSDDLCVEQARQVIEQCLQAESQRQDKDAMYLEQTRTAGLYDAFVLRIELEEDRALRHRLKRTVDKQKHDQNPFEDQNLIVLDDDDIEPKSQRQVDSGFYDGWTTTTTSVNM